MIAGKSLQRTVPSHGQEKAEETLKLDTILFKCCDILRKARNSGSFFEKRDMMLILVFLRFIGKKFEGGVENLRQNLIKEGLDPDDEVIKAAFLDDPTFTDGTYNLPIEARWQTIINTPAPKLNVALDTALHSIAASSRQLKGRFVEGTFTTRNLAPNDIKQVVDEVGKISRINVYGQEKEAATYRLAKMNLALRGISHHLGGESDSTFTHDLHKGIYFHYIMANPPFKLMGCYD